MERIQAGHEKVVGVIKKFIKGEGIRQCAVCDQKTSKFFVSH
jgi:hypothetical protein